MNSKIPKLNSQNYAHMEPSGLREGISKEIKDVLSNYRDIKLGIIFGSVAALRNRPNSDVDLGVAASAILSVEERIALIGDLSAKLVRQLDLVDLMAANGPILQQILCRGYIIFNQDTSLYARLILKMWYNQAHVMPYYYRTLEIRRKRLING